jgi:hypothetical protein
MSALVESEPLSLHRLRSGEIMYGLTQKNPKQLLTWKHLLPRCARPGCATGTRWSGVLHRATGFWFNEQKWFCSARCLAESIEDHLLGYFFEEHRPAPIRTAMPLGLMMLARGVISDPQLRDAIAMQRSSGEKIGVCLQRLACISHDDIASAVATQWGCPVFPAESVQPGCSMLVPFNLLERFRMAPVHLVGQGRRLFVGFCDKVNYTALICIQHMLGCETEACIISEPKLRQVLEYRKRDTAGEIAVTRPHSAAETTRMILSYAQQTGAEAIHLREMEGNIWVRFLSQRSHLDLVFEFPSL